MIKKPLFYANLFLYCGKEVVGKVPGFVYYGESVVDYLTAEGMGKIEKALGKRKMTNIRKLQKQGKKIRFVVEDKISVGETSRRFKE
jgi:hypothetical protein